MKKEELFFLGTVLIGLMTAPNVLWGQTAGGFAYVANCGVSCGGGKFQLQ